MNIRSIYRRLPERFRSILSPFIRLYHSPKLLFDFIEKKSAYYIFKKSQYWSKEKHEEYPLKKLKQVVREAYKHVPYYKRLFDEHNITPDDIQALENIHKIPFLTKEIVRKNIDDLISRKYKKDNLFVFVKFIHP